MTDNEIENSSGAPAFRDQIETAVQSLREEVERQLDESRTQLQKLVDGFVENLPEPPAPPPTAPAPEPEPAPEPVPAPVPTNVVPVGGPAMADLRDAVAELDEADNQAELMARLVEQASTFASRTVLLLDNQEKGLKSWASLGFGRAGTSLEGLELPVSEEPAWQAARDSAQSLTGAQCAPLWQFIDVEQPMMGALIPLSVRGKVLAFLYADQTSPGNRFSIEALQLLTHSAAQKLDLLPLGSHGPSATLRLHSSDDRGLGLGSSGAAAVGAVTAESSVESPAQETGFEPPPPPMPSSPMTLEDEAAPEPTIEEPPATMPEPDSGYGEAQTAEDFVTPAVETSAELEIPGASLDVETFDPVSEPPEVEEHSRLTPAERDAGFVLEEIPSEQSQSVDAQPGYEMPPEVESAPAFEPVEEEHQPEHPTAPPPGFTEPATEASPPPASDAPPPPAGEALPTPPASEAPPAPPAPPAPAPVSDQEPAFQSAGFRPDPPPQPASEAPSPSPSPVAFEPAPEPAGLEGSLATQVITPEQIAALGKAGPATLSTSVAEPPPEPPPPAEAVFEEVPQSSSGASMSSSQVIPPADLQGPGLAFQETKAPGDDPAHEEAKRLARLLVSEIKLYNGEQIRAGKVAGNIYGQMRDDIDRSRQMYDERIDARVKESSDYFRDELVRTLADGDDSILGM